MCPAQKNESERTALSLDYNATRSFTMTLAHRAVGDIRRGGFPTAAQLRRYVFFAGQTAAAEGLFAYAQKALQRTDSCYYSLVHNLLDTVDEDRLCTVGVNMGFGGLIYGASEEEAGRCGWKALLLDHGRPLRRPGPPALVAAAREKGQLCLGAGCH